MEKLNEVTKQILAGRFCKDSVIAWLPSTAVFHTFGM